MGRLRAGWKNSNRRGATAESSTDPITPELSNAFHDAVWMFDAWDPSTPEREVTIDNKFFR
jgi:hypothetical protein